MVLRLIAVLVLVLAFAWNLYAWLHMFSISEASVLVVAAPTDGKIIEMLDVFETARACTKYKDETDKDSPDQAAWSKCMTVTEIHNP